MDSYGNPCKYGFACYQINPTHFQRFSHSHLDEIIKQYETTGKMPAYVNSQHKLQIEIILTKSIECSDEVKKVFPNTSLEYKASPNKSKEKDQSICQARDQCIKMTPNHFKIWEHPHMNHLVEHFQKHGSLPDGTSGVMFKQVDILLDIFNQRNFQSHSDSSEEDECNSFFIEKEEPPPSAQTKPFSHNAVILDLDCTTEESATLIMKWSQQIKSFDVASLRNYYAKRDVVVGVGSSVHAVLGQGGFVNMVLVDEVSEDNSQTWWEKIGMEIKEAAMKFWEFLPGKIKALHWTPEDDGQCSERNDCVEVNEFNAAVVSSEHEDDLEGLIEGLSLNNVLEEVSKVNIAKIGDAKKGGDTGSCGEQEHEGGSSRNIRRKRFTMNGGRTGRTGRSERSGIAERGGIAVRAREAERYGGRGEKTARGGQTGQRKKGGNVEKYSAKKCGTLSKFLKNNDVNKNVEMVDLSSIMTNKDKWITMLKRL